MSRKSEEKASPQEAVADIEKSIEGPWAQGEDGPCQYCGLTFNEAPLPHRGDIDGDDEITTCPKEEDLGDFWCSDRGWSKRERTKLAWAKSLKVGDVVCDCRGLHRAIAELRVRKNVHPWAVWLADKLTVWMGEDSDIGFGIFLFIRNTADWLRIRKFSDVDLVLEDGAICSAMSCCSDIAFCALDGCDGMGVPGEERVTT